MEIVNFIIYGLVIICLLMIFIYFCSYIDNKNKRNKIDQLERMNKLGLIAPDQLVNEVNKILKEDDDKK